MVNVRMVLKQSRGILFF